MARTTKPKYEPVDRETDEGAGAYAVLQEARDRWCDHLDDCNIVLLWVFDVKPDKDGHVVLGKNAPVTEQDRELHGYDRKILLNRETWTFFSPEQRLALMHHELLHTDEAVDKDLEPLLDGHGKRLWRTVKHDIEEFFAVVRTHGCYKADLQAFADAMVGKGAQLDLPVAAAGDGASSVTPGTGEAATTITASELREWPKDPPTQRKRSAPPLQGAVDRLAAVVGDGVESVTLSMPGRDPVTITPKMGAAARKRLRAKGAASPEN